MNDNRRDSSLPIALEECMKPLTHITAAVAGIGETSGWIDKMVIPKVGVLVEQSKLYSDTYSSLSMALEGCMKPLTHIAAAVAGIGETASWIDKMVIPKVGVLVEQSKLSIDTYSSLSKVLEERMKPLTHITAAVAGIDKMNTGVKALTAITAGMPKYHDEFRKMGAGLSAISAISAITAGMPNYHDEFRKMGAGLSAISAISAITAGMPKYHHEFRKMSAGVHAMSVLGAVRPSVHEELSKSVVNTSLTMAGNKSHKKYYDDIYSNVVYGKFQESHELTIYDHFERSDIEDLEYDLERVLQHTPELRARLPIIKQALVSHRDRRFLVSIPCLLTQFEGLLVDYLVSENLLTVEGYKVYIKQDDAKNHNRSELNGLKRVAKIIENSGSSKIHFLAVHIKKLLGDERNAILHGRKSDYGSADFSSWLIRCIYTLACNLYSNEALRHLENITKIRIVH